MKKTLKIFILLIIASYMIYSVIYVTNTINIDGTLLAEQIAILNTPKIFVILFKLLFLSLVIIVFITCIFSAYKTCFDKNISDKERFYFRMIIKTLIIFSIIGTLLICLNETQFSIVTTLVSFIAIFSFVFNDEQKRKIETFFINLKKHFDGF